MTGRQAEERTVTGRQAEERTVTGRLSTLSTPGTGSTLLVRDERYAVAAVQLGLSTATKGSILLQAADSHGPVLCLLLVSVSFHGPGQPSPPCRGPDHGCETDPFKQTPILLQVEAGARLSTDRSRRLVSAGRPVPPEPPRPPAERGAPPAASPHSGVSVPRWTMKRCGDAKPECLNSNPLAGAQRRVSFAHAAAAATGRRRAPHPGLSAGLWVWTVGLGCESGPARRHRHRASPASAGKAGTP